MSTQPTFEEISENTHKKALSILSQYPYSEVNLALKKIESDKLDMEMTMGIMNYLAKKHETVALYALLNQYLIQLNKINLSKKTNK